LNNALPFLDRKIHPILIIKAFKQALEDALEVLDQVAQPVNINSKSEMKKLIQASIGTKMVNAWADLMCDLAYQAVKTVSLEKNGKTEVDIKRYARIEKVWSC
jgi:T-complex protein 1 subunit gamma